MSPTPGSDFDVVINSVGYMLDRDDKTGTPRFWEGRAETITPMRGGTVLDQEASNPLDKYVLAHIDSFHDGFGASTYDPNDRYRYGVSSGAFMAAKGTVGPNNKLYHIGFGIVDPDAEEAATPWTVSNAACTATLSVANSYEGEYHWAFTSSVNNGQAYQSLANPTVLRTFALTFDGMGRMSAAATGEAVRLFIATDGTGGTTTYSSAVATTTWTAMTVTLATVPADATYVRVGITDNGTLIDTETARVDALGIASAGTDTPVGFADYNGQWYTAAGRFVYQWDETNNKFDIVSVAAADATDIETFSGNVYVATGNGNSFVYGATTSWTTSNRTGTDDEADFFARGIDRNGNAVMWRGLKASTVSISDNPANSGTAWTDYTVGETDSALTGLHWWNRTILVGKEDGLYAFQGNHFANVTSEKKVAQSTTNFAKGQEWLGACYLSGPQGTVWRFMLGLMQGPLEQFRMEGVEYGPGGEVGALGTDGTSLLVGTKRRNSANHAWVLQSFDGQAVHTLYDFNTSDAADLLPSGTGMDVHAEEIHSITAIGTFSNYTYVAGTTEAGVTRIGVVRWLTPTTDERPFRDTSPDPQSKYYIRLPRMVGGFPTETKSVSEIVVGSRNLSAGSCTIPVYYRVDNGNWVLYGTIDTSPNDSITSTAVNGKEIELVLAPSGNTAASPIEVSYVTVKGTLRATRKRSYAVWLKIGEAGSLAGEGEALYSNLRTAEASSDPITFSYVEDFREGGNATSVTSHVVGVQLDKVVTSDRGYVRVYRVSLVEA